MPAERNSHMGKSLLVGRHVFGLERAELGPGRKQEGWDGGVLCSASCPSLISTFDLSPSSCWCFGSAQPWFADQLPEMAREREEHCCCPSEEDLTCWTGAVEGTALWELAAGVSWEGVSSRNLA